MKSDEYPIDRGGSAWDRIWRGRASSHRRALSNAALHAARCATALGEAAKLVDTIAGDRRSLEIAGLAREIGELSEAMRACADHLLAEAGVTPFEPPSRVSWWRWLRG